MASVHKSAASLRISGEDLIPDEISAAIGSSPTLSYRKGEVHRFRNGGEVIRKTGMWLVTADDCEPEDIDRQVRDLLSRLTPELRIWDDLSQRFEIDLYCGLFMEEANEGLSLSIGTLRALADRNIELGVDIYAPTREVANDDPCPCGSGKLYRDCCAPKQPA
jgi:hypothetical protein